MICCNQCGKVIPAHEEITAGFESAVASDDGDELEVAYGATRKLVLRFRGERPEHYHEACAIELALNVLGTEAK